MSIVAPSRPPHLAIPVEPLDAALVLDIAAGLARARTLWEGRVRHDGPARHAVRLLAPDRYEVWLIGWPAGHRTTPHDHGDSVGAFIVAEGTLVERTGADRRHLAAGDAVFLPAGGIHDVGTLDGSATSIHLYSPPLSTMTFYEDGTGLPDHVFDVVDETPLLDADDVARALHPTGGTSRG